MPTVKAAPSPPSWLSPEAKAEWRRVVPELARLKVLSKINRSALTAYCCSWATFVRAQRELDSGRITVETERGFGRNPAWQVAREAQREMRAWCAEFGLTPSSSGRMTLPEQGDPDDDGILD